jgi:hypothetical protein
MGALVISSLERAAIFMQAVLDKITERIEQDRQMVEFHSIYCPCERCTLQREKEKERRDKK